jgi:RNA polymerase sigma-70 factor (ECF subfamily)
MEAEALFRDALEELVRRHQNEMFGFCKNMLSDPGVAEEIAQEVFLAAWRGLPNFRQEASPRTWLFSIARHKCLDARGGLAWEASMVRNVEAEHTSALAIQKAVGTPEELYAAQDLSSKMEQFLAQLPDADREILVLTYIVELGPTEVVKVLGIAPASVRTRRRRAIQRLREIMQNDAER